MSDVKFSSVAITKNSFPLEAGDMLERWGSRFRKVKGRYGRPVFVVAAVNEDNDSECFMSAVVGYHQFNNTIIDPKGKEEHRDRVIGKLL